MTKKKDSPLNITEPLAAPARIIDLDYENRKALVFVENIYKKYTIDMPFDVILKKPQIGDKWLVTVYDSEHAEFGRMLIDVKNK